MRLRLGEEHEGYAPQGRILPDHFQGTEALGPGHERIQDDGVRPLATGRLIQGRSVGGDLNSEGTGLSHILQPFTQLTRVVVDQEH